MRNIGTLTCHPPPSAPPPTTQAEVITHRPSHSVCACACVRACVCGWVSNSDNSRVEPPRHLGLDARRTRATSSRCLASVCLCVCVHPRVCVCAHLLQQHRHPLPRCKSACVCACVRACACIRVRAQSCVRARRPHACARVYAHASECVSLGWKRRLQSNKSAN